MMGANHHFRLGRYRKQSTKMASLDVNGLYGGMGMECDKARKLGRRRWTERQVCRCL